MVMENLFARVLLLVENIFENKILRELAKNHIKEKFFSYNGIWIHPVYSERTMFACDVIIEETLQGEEIDNFDFFMFSHQQ